MKERPIDLISPSHTEYVHRMAREIRERGLVRPTKILPQDMDPKEREAAILAMQSPSTRRTLQRDPSEDETWRNRPLDMSCQIVKSADEMDKFERKITPEEYQIHTLMRAHPDRNSFAQPEGTGANAIRREAAANAWLFSPPAQIGESERERLTEIKPYAPPPEPPTPKPKPKSRWGWLRGKFWTFGRLE